MGPSQSSQALNRGFELFSEGHLPDELIVLFESGEPGERFELLECLFLMFIPIFVHFLLVVVLKQPMLKHKFFYFRPFIQSAVVFSDDEMLYSSLLLCIVIPKF